MNDLTEKWKAGELEEGWYYIKYEDNHVGIAFACGGLGRDEYPFVGFEFEDDIEEVLAPVPSYDELQALKEENANLKELLKECKEHLCHHYCQMTVGKLEKKIEEILK